MKKILSALTAVVIIGCMSLSVYAAQSSVSIKNNVFNSKPISYNYDFENSGETVKSIKTLMTKLDTVNKQSSVVQTLTITSSSANNKPVNFKLRLSMPEKNNTVKPEAVSTPSPDELSSLDYYNLKVTSADGEVIYDYETAEKNDGAKTYKDISLGALNKTSGSESKIYNVTISLNNNLDKNSIATNAKKLDWSIVSDTYTTEEPETTAAPSEEFSEKAATPTPQAKKQSDSYEFNDGEYIVGDDIPAGRYTMTGEGKVHVYTPEDVLKTTIALKSKSDSSSNGVAEYVINLEDGEKVNVETTAKFTPYSQSSSPKPTSAVKATATPKVTTASKATSSPSQASSSKNNPKTGDTAPLLGISAIGLLSLCGALFIAYKKGHN